ncbi:hypothetical protein C3L33_08817, partial [Rhododendron williamsianum]
MLQKGNMWLQIGLLGLLRELAKLSKDGYRRDDSFGKLDKDLSQSKFLLEELDLKAVALHSLKTQSLRLATLHRFKLVLLATNVASRGLDIPIVDLVINYDMISQGYNF